MIYNNPLEFMMFYWWDQYSKFFLHSIYVPYEIMGQMSSLDTICKS